MLSCVHVGNTISTVEFPDAPRFISTLSNRQVRAAPKYFINTLTFIGLELSLVPEVEQVFVDLGEGKEFRVTTVVNTRSPELRKKVYRREQAVMDELKGLVFDFQIIERLDRKLDDVVTGAGKLAFKRQ